MVSRWLCGAALVALAGCSPEAAQAPANETATANAPEPAQSPAPPPPAADAPLRDWLVGTWSYDTNCVTDFLLRYEADGVLYNAGETGRWTLEGDTVTDTVTERLGSGGEVPMKLDPPIVRSYRVSRGDATHGTITIDGRTVPILRC